MSKKSRQKKEQVNNFDRKSFFSLDRDEFTPLLIIVLAAVILRVLYVWQLQHSIFFGNYILDSKVIDAWARQIALGQSSDPAPFFRAPLYAYVVGMIYRIFGVSPAPVIFFQSLLGIGTVLLTFFYARYLFGKRISFIAGLITAFWPTLIYFEGELMITTLAVFLFMASLVSLHLAIVSGTTKKYFLAGIILGLAGITRPTILPLFLIVPIYYFLTKMPDRYNKMLRHTVIYIIGIIIPILPVTVRNIVVSGDPVLISTQGGANFYIGNSDYADGLTVAMPSSGSIFEEEYVDNIYSESIKLAERETGRDMTDSEVSGYWYGKAFDDILSDPIRFAGLFIKKFYLFWHGQEIFNNKSLYFSSSYSVLMKLLLWKHILNFPSGLLIPLMLAGIYIPLRETKGKRNLIPPLSAIIIFSLAISLFFVCSRFRQQVIPVAIIFSSVAVLYVIDAFRQKKSGWTIPLIIFIGGLVLFNAGGDIESIRNKSQYQNILGTVYLQKGQPQEAIIHLERALAIAPDNRAAVGSLGYAYVQANRPQDAERVFLKGIEMFPRSWQLTYNLATLYYRYGKFDKAKPFLRKAVSLDPGRIDPYKGLGAIYEDEGLTDSAKIIYRQLLKIDPQNQAARQKLESLE